MFKNITIYISLVLLMIYLASAQEAAKKITGYMGGQIFDDDESTALEGAKIIIQHVDTGNEYSDTSSKDGTYFIKNIPPGLYNVTIIYLNAEYKYPGQILAEAKEKFYIKACWATKHEKMIAKLIDRECKTREPIAWWKQKKFIIIGGSAAAAAAAAIILKEEKEASPSKP